MPQANNPGIGEQRAAQIKALLIDKLAAERVEIRDRTWQHRRHEGAKDGRGHFELTVVSPRFAGKPPLARHRMVYAALGELLTTDIHALKIHALEPGTGSSTA